MSNTHTVTETWSRTRARYVGGKVIADLRGFSQAYGAPSEQRLEAYLQELVELLDGGYIKEVSYGFKLNGGYVAALKYVADMTGELAADDRSGRIPRGADTTSTTFGSFLEYSQKWWNLSEEDRNRIKAKLPFVRGDGSDPGAGISGWVSDKTYSSAGNGFRRSTYGS